MIHRDIKPSNIWLEEKLVVSQASEADAARNDSIALKPTSRRVKILDFGLARTVEGVSQEGEQRSILGTPAYMSPEHPAALMARFGSGTSKWAKYIIA